MILYETHKSREWRRKAEEVLPQIRTSAPLCANSAVLALSHSTHTYISGYKKGKEKKQILYL